MHAQRSNQHRSPSVAFRRTGLATAFGMLSFGCGTLFAADSQIEEVLVVGQGIGSLRLNGTNGAGSRLGLNALETPASVDLITRDEITAKGDYATIDSITRTAGMSTSSDNGNGGMQVSSRGFNGHGTTAYTYDGTRLYIAAGTVTFPADSWTLERVEVLRGAGSVINGVGALATTVNYVPRAPEFGPARFDALAAAGSFGLRRMALGGGMQLNDQAALRADAAFTTKNGYVDRGDEERQVGAVSFLYRPVDSFSMKFSVDYADIDAPRYWGTPLINGQASDALRKNNYNFEDAVINYKDVWARVRTEWQMTPAVTFRNDTFVIRADREWQNLEEYYHDGANAIDRVSYLGIVHDQEQMGTRGDFLVIGTLGAMENRFTVGAELNAIDFNYLNNFNTGGFDVSDTVPVFGFTPGLRPAAAFTQLDYSTDLKQHAFFFDDVLQLNDQWSLALGGRYDTFDFERVTHAQPTGRSRSTFGANYSDFTWRAGIVYLLNENLSLYAQTSTASDPITSPVSLSLANANFDLSEGRQYEVGLKQQFMGGRGEYTLAYFDIRKDDLVTRLPGATVNSQIGQQSSDGIELTFRFNPVDAFSVDFNAAFIDSRYDEFYVGTTSLAGNTPRGVPDTTLNLWLNWRPLARLQLGAGARYVDERYTSDSNTAVLPDYTVFDASVSWNLSAQTQLALRGRNLTDEKDYVYSEYTTDQWVFGEPRAYELSVRHSF